MATAVPLEFGPQPANDRDGAGPRSLELGRAYAEHLRVTDPAHFASLGVTVDEYAARFVEPAMTIEESVAAGHMSAAEGRYLRFCATREDLIELGHAPDEIDAILDDQRAHACASSS